MTDGSGTLYEGYLGNRGVIPVTRFNFKLRSLGPLVSDGQYLWVADGTNLIKLNPYTAKQERVIRGTGPISALTFDGNFVWAGTANGVVKYDPLKLEQVTIPTQSLPSPSKSSL